jgi:uncharacterized protein YndB with AHSA1/START domain
VSEAKPAPEAVKIEKQIELDAPVETVWNALVNGTELSRWFPLEASVEPRKGGKISLSWGPEWTGTADIDLWEPNHRLRSVQMVGRQPATVDWTIESRGGKTLLRVTQSSFMSGEDWEQEYFDSTDYGWGFMLVNLRHYLEQHAGQPRLVAWARQNADMPRQVIYDKLVGRNGIFSEDASQNLRQGERYSMHAAGGELWTGRAEFGVPSRGFCVSVDSLNNALAWLTIEGAKAPHDVQFWFSIYGLPASRVSDIQKSWNEKLKTFLAV